MLISTLGLILDNTVGECEKMVISATYCTPCETAGDKGSHDVVHAVFIRLLLALSRGCLGHSALLCSDRLCCCRRTTTTAAGSRILDDGARSPNGAVDLADEAIIGASSSSFPLHLGDGAIVGESRWHLRPQRHRLLCRGFLAQAAQLDVHAGDDE